MPAKFALIGYDETGAATLLRGPDSDYTAQVKGWVAIRLGKTRPEGISVVENWQSDRGVIALADLDQIARNNGQPVPVKVAASEEAWPGPTLKETRKSRKTLP